MTKHTCSFKPGRGSVDVCKCGRFRHNAKAGPFIVEQPVLTLSQQAQLVTEKGELIAALDAMTKIATYRWRPLPADSHEKKTLNTARAILAKVA